MPTVKEYQDGMKFIIHQDDHNPPHAHVKLSSGESYRINLKMKEFMKPSPTGKTRKTINKRFRDNRNKLSSEWNKHHPNRFQPTKSDTRNPTTR